MAPSGTVTSRVDRLEAAELVQRRDDPSDGRGRLVRLTPTGRHTVDAALADLVAREAAILHGLSERQRTTLAGLLRRLVTPFDAA
jgi:DNA-binding MarR family transcriptional regulator